jgi:endonuclease/exonuclease/phosphatase family metal-dependent hydrolase
MLTKLGKLCRVLLRRSSRTYLLGRWLGLDVNRAECRSAGLIILQVDGVSRQQFEAAVAKNRLPFLKKLIHSGYFRRLSFYSGLPSATPAVQAEVMYGVECAVPAFQFLHRKSGRIFRMYEQEAAATIVQEQLSDSDPLLVNGVSYSNIYSGGAEEAQCCAETQSFTALLKRIRPLRLFFTMLLYSFTLLRIIGLAIVELFVAVADMCRGVWTRRDWHNEVKFVPARVLISIVLREWVRIVVKLSIASGTPVIYANLLGYDEQSHRRGPASSFAHWGLKGIDGVIKDIFRTARRADSRDYEIVVFSDHGQEAVRVYDFEYGKTIQQAVKDVLTSGPLSNRAVINVDAAPRNTQHLDQWMRRQLNIRRGRVEGQQISAEELAENVIVTAMGPLGHIYFPLQLADTAKAEYAMQLVNREHVPLVLYRVSDGEIYGRNRRGLWKISEDCLAICGTGQRFIDEIRNDLVKLFNNPNSGDLIISGWDPDQEPLTFVQETGAHGSIGSQETRGFALLPPGFAVNTREGTNGEVYIRGVDLHGGALEFLRRTEEADLERCKRAAAILAAERVKRGGCCTSSTELPPERLRVMTYNVHHSIGMDGRCRPERIANVIAEAEADVVALQEMDDNRERTQFKDQTQIIASRLGMYHRFFPVLTEGAERYGLAILSRFPFVSVFEEVLTQADPRRRIESRGAMWVKLETDAGAVHVINTHLGLRSNERLRQVEALLGSRWLADLETREPVILCGDFNAGPNSEVMQRLRRRFRCVQAIATDHVPQLTFPSVLPLRRIDHVLVSSHFQVSSVSAIRNHMTTLASDHLPVCAELTLNHELKRIPPPEHRRESGCMKPDQLTGISESVGISARDDCHVGQ